MEADLLEFLGVQDPGCVYRVDVGGGRDCNIVFQPRGRIHGDTERQQIGAALYPIVSGIVADTFPDSHPLRATHRGYRMRSK
jgi:hypothetical protein